MRIRRKCSVYKKYDCLYDSKFVFTPDVRVCMLVCMCVYIDINSKKDVVSEIVSENEKVE